MKTKRYLIEKAIGEGGTAFVHRAFDRRIGRPVAIKRFKEETEETEYLSELEAISRIAHPNVVCSYDADRDEDGSFIVMELIEGNDVESLVSSLPFSLGTFLDFARQCLEALNATHASGILHLDIKPANIMITDLGGSRDTVKLVDFGRAERAQDDRGQQPQGRGMDGSVYFTSPEQFLCDPLDQRTDLYALGCVFYWCLSGQRPFAGDNLMVVMASHMQHRVDPLSSIAPHIPVWLAEWVMKFIEYHPEDRPASARHAFDELTKSLLLKIGA